MKCKLSTHMNHVSVSPTNGNDRTKGQRKILTRVGIEPTTFGLDHSRSRVSGQGTLKYVS